jgi:hypothetical protein
LALQPNTRSILTELDTILLNRDKHNVIESKSVHVMNSAINLINLIKENFDQEVADDLEKRLINAIRSQDPNKFIRGIRKAQ